MSADDAKQKNTIDVLLEEERSFEPSKAFKAQANLNHPSIFAKSFKDPEAYWEKWAEELHWFKKWDKILEWEPPNAKWFVGGKLNAAYNCVDRHLENGLRNKAAIIWEGEPGDKRTMTYWDLARDVKRFACALKRLGVKKGDRVAIYLPMIPEMVVTVLACARIGAVHSVVFAGFSPEALAERINDAEAKVLITADGGYRRGSIIPLKARC